MTTRDATHKGRSTTQDDEDETGRDEELTPTEPHKCAYIHWERSQSNREMGT